MVLHGDLVSTGMNSLRFSKITIWDQPTNTRKECPQFRQRSSALLPFFGNHLGGHRYPPGPPALNESYGLSMIIRDDPRSSMIIHKMFFIIHYPPKYPKYANSKVLITIFPNHHHSSS
jgi:hypothetical protein